jgi:ParB family chromosome partitioning protein
MSKTDALHRLLGTRISSDAAQPGETVGVQSLAAAKVIDIDRIVADPTQPRREFDETEMAELAASLRDLGQQQPIRVRWDAQQERYVIIAGERRWRAAKQAGLKTLSAITDEKTLAADRVLEMQIVENALRSDLTPIEAGAAYRLLMQTWGCTQQQLAARLHVSQSKVSRALQALDLPEPVKAAVSQGKVGAVAAVKKQATQRAARKQTKKGTRPSRLVTPIGTVVVTPKAGQSVVDVLLAAIEQERGRAAA